MKTKNKMLKKLTAVLCAATMVASGAAASVGAVNVAPSHAYNQSLVNNVNNLNNKLDGLTNALTSLQQRVNKVADMYIHVKDDYVYVPKNDEGLKDIDALRGNISNLIYFVDRIKGINTARNETYAIILSSYLDTVTKEIENNIKMTDFDINFYNGTISKNILKYRERIGDLADKLVKDDNNNHNHNHNNINPINNINNHNNHHNNIIKKFNNIDFKNINNNKIKSNSNINHINNHNNNNRRNNNNNHHNNIIINNINNNLNNQNWNLNDKDKMNAAAEIIRIRDVISTLNDDKNIEYRVAFEKTGYLRTALHEFQNAFYGPEHMKCADVHTRGLYPIITKHRYEKDFNRIKGYFGQYPVLENLNKVCSVGLLNEYYTAVKINKSLTYEEFRSKIKQKAKEADDLLNTIARSLGIQ